jgi:hypothetical protein
VQRQADDVTTLAESAYRLPPLTPLPETPPTDPAPHPPPAQASAEADAAQLAARDRLLALSHQRPLNLDDPGDIEELAVRIYQKIHGRLRRELLVDRERAGRLSGTGPFGHAR